MQDVPNCPGCGKTGGVPAGSFVGKPQVEVEVNGFGINVACIVNYKRCLHCGMFWQSPRMSDEQLDKWYSEGHYRQWLEQPQTTLDIDEYGRAEKTEDWIRMYANRGEITSFLDFGCSRGYLLDFMAKVSPNVLGVEENLNYVRTDEKVIQNLKEVQGRFDIITAIHVLEHLPDPLSFLLYIQQYLSTGGLLFLEIPSTASKGGPFRLAHLTYMEPPVLVGLCTRAGLTVLDVSISTDGHTRVVCTTKGE